MLPTAAADSRKPNDSDDDLISGQHLRILDFSGNDQAEGNYIVHPYPPAEKTLRCVNTGSEKVLSVA